MNDQWSGMDRAALEALRDLDERRHEPFFVDEALRHVPFERVRAGCPKEALRRLSERTSRPTSTRVLCEMLKLT